MGLPDRSRMARARLDVERLEDRTTPTKMPDAFGPALEATGAFAPDRVNVVLAAETTAADAAALAAPFALEVTPLGFGIYSVSLAPGTEVGAAVGYYSARPGVLSAAPDEIVQLQLTPDDPRLPSLYGITKIGAPAAWDTTTGDGDFVVAVIDTGVDYNHPDLAANIWSNADEVAGNGLDDDGNGFIDDTRGWDFVSNDNNPMDDNNHGTHVAGTIGAVGNNGVGVVGVNWSVQIMPLKFLGASGSGSISGAVAALNYAVTNGARVSNNSWGGGGFSSTLSAAIDRAQDAGHIFVAAAGNSGQNIDSTPSYPASYIQSYDNVVTVAATGSTDALASFSNYGASSVTLAAPGVSILSTTRNNTYSSFSGTSMATPHVAGAIALYWGANPDLTYTQVIDKLESSVDLVAGLAGRVATGGRLNVANMLASTSPPVVAPGPKVTAATFSGAAGQFDTLRITFDRAVDASTFTGADIGSFTGPNGVITTAYAVSPATGSSSVFDVTFAAQTAPGAYSMVLGPDIRDTAGNPMNQNGNAAAGEVPGDQYTAAGSLVLSVSRTYNATGLPLSIRDGRYTNSYLSVPDNIAVTDLNVQVTLTHTWVSDLVIDLFAPNGSAVRLFNRRGGSGNNLTNTVFNDEASVHISAGAAPFGGSFRPEQALSAFDGRSAQGTWRLRVYDAAWSDTGSLWAWSLAVTGTSGAGGQRAQAKGFLDEPSEPAVTDELDLPLAEEIAGPLEEEAVAPAPEAPAVIVFLAPEAGRAFAQQPAASEPRDEGDPLPAASDDFQAPAVVAFAPLDLAPEDAAEEADAFEVIEVG